MDKNYITEGYEKKQIDIEPTVEAKLWSANLYAARRTKVDQLFALKSYVNSLSFFKRTLLKRILEPFFNKIMQEIPDTISKEGTFGYPWVSLKD